MVYWINKIFPDNLKLLFILPLIIFILIYKILIIIFESSLILKDERIINLIFLFHIYLYRKMTDLFIIIGVIVLLLLFLYFGFKYNLTIEKFDDRGTSLIGSSDLTGYVITSDNISKTSPSPPVQSPPVQSPPAQSPPGERTPQQILADNQLLNDNTAKTRAQDFSKIALDKKNEAETQYINTLRAIIDGSSIDAITNAANLARTAANAAKIASDNAESEAAKISDPDIKGTANAYARIATDARDNAKIAADNAEKAKLAEIAARNARQNAASGADAGAGAATSPSPEPASVLTNDNLINLLAVINAYPPVAIYHPIYGNTIGIDDAKTKLYNLVDPSKNKYASIINGGVVQVLNGNNGNTNVNFNPNGTLNLNAKYVGQSNINYLQGTFESKITFDPIPQNFTLCTITRYTTPEKRNTILTSRSSSIQSSTNDNNNNLWFHGHNNGKRGIVCYNKYLTNNNENYNDNVMDDYATHDERKHNWVVTCAKNCANSAPNNVIINGLSMGVTQDAGVGGGGNVLSINDFSDNSMNTNNLSNYALSYIFLWDVCLSDLCMKYVSDALIYYLNSGVELLYDYNALKPGDKNIINNKKISILNADNIDKQNREWADWLKTQQLSQQQSQTTTTTTSQTQGSTQNKCNVRYEPQGLSDYKRVADTYYNPDFAKLINKFNINIENQNEYQQKILELLKKNLIKKEPNSDAEINTLTIDKILNNIASLDNQLSNKKPIFSSSDIINYNKNRNSICSLVDKMPDPSQQSFKKSYDSNGPDPLSTDKDDQSYLWCKCNPDNYNTDLCKAFNTCRINYSNNNTGNNTGVSTFSSVTGVDKEIYKNCVNAFSTFPKYLNN